MPKVLIRELDNSTTGFPASDNFAVVVPGYFGTPGIKNKDTNEYYDPTALLIDHDVYELRSQSDFISYIGKHTSTKRDPVDPILTVINTAANANDYTKYVRKLTTKDFDRYLDPENREILYRAAEITSSSDPMYNKNGYLVKTFSYFEKVKKQAVAADGTPLTDEDTGLPIYSVINPDTGEEIPENEFSGDVKNYVYIDDTTETKTKTVRFTKIQSLEEITWTGDGIGLPESNEAAYCVIEMGKEGSDAIQFAHIGNQIAYELLGLGYTVLYKKLDENNESQRLQKLNEADFWEPLKDKSVFNFRYVTTGGYYSSAAMTQICNLAAFVNNTKLEDAETYGKLSGRGDCIALCDIDENMGGENNSNGRNISSNLTLQQLIQNIGYAAKAIQANEYSAIFAPRVTYIMNDLAVKDFGNNKTFPASFHYLACAARTFNRYNEWYAVAGYNRGISNYSIETTSVKLGEIAINTLAPRIANTYTDKSINLILHERGNYYLWGNRTAKTLDAKGIVFHHFLNIRQLCCSIKQQLYTACRQFTFDPNSDLLWINFVNAIKPTLEAMKADQGIKGYTISRVANDKKALLTARIRIVPIEAVEDFDISIYLEDSLTGIVVSADETQA